MPQQIGELPFKVEKEVFGAAGEGLGGLGGVWADWQLNFGARHLVVVTRAIRNIDTVDWVGSARTFLSFLRPPFPK